MGTRPTIQMVAELAGVSRGTVDRVLNDRPHVNEEVRQRVLEALADGRLTAADVRRSACRVLRLMLNAHTQVLMNGEESK